MFENILSENTTFKMYDSNKKKEMIKNKFVEFFYSELIKDKILKEVTKEFVKFKYKDEKINPEKYSSNIKIFNELKKYFNKNGPADYEHRFKRVRIDSKAKMIRLTSVGIDIITEVSYDYPEALKNIIDIPRVLYLLGDRKLLNADNCIGIVGSRECSFQSSKLAKSITKRLVEKDYVTVSGLASGIDGSVHKETIKQKGKTIAVIGTGFSPQAFYPKINFSLFQDIIKNNGLVISEYDYDKRGSRYTFPRRNRIIAALCSSLIVVQAKINSGSIITANKALEYGKNIYVPLGLVGDTNFLGTNLLIRDGAIPITDLEDLDLFF